MELESRIKGHNTAKFNIVIIYKNYEIIFSFYLEVKAYSGAPQGSVLGHSVSYLSKI